MERMGIIVLVIAFGYSKEGIDYCLSSPKPMKRDDCTVFTNESYYCCYNETTQQCQSALRRPIEDNPDEVIQEVDSCCLFNEDDYFNSSQQLYSIDELPMKDYCVFSYNNTRAFFKQVTSMRHTIIGNGVSIHCVHSAFVGFGYINIMLFLLLLFQ